MNKLLTVLFLLLFTVPAYADWVEPDSSNYKSHCGDTSGHTVEEMLDATDEWWHVVNETHNLVLDMKYTRNIKKFRFRGLETNAPDDMDIYISTNPTSWGAAVATAVSPHDCGNNWCTTDTTDKEGRYIKFIINSTTHANDYLGWGENNYPTNQRQVISFWEGDIPDCYTSYINFSNSIYTTTSQTYVPKDGSLGYIPWDGSKHSDIESAYLEVSGYATGSCAPNAEPTLFAALYDGSNEFCAVANVAGASNVFRGAECSSSLPAGTASLELVIKRGCQTSATVTGARLVLTQKSDVDGNKTRIYIPLGGSINQLGTSYQKLGNIGVASSEEKQYYWDDGDWSTVSAVYYGATLKVTSGGTAYAKIDTAAGGASLAELTEVSTSWTWNISSDISGSIVDNTLYTTWLKVVGIGKQTYIANAMLIIDVDPLANYQTAHQFNSYGYSIATTGWTSEPKQGMIFDSDSFVGVTDVVTHQGVIKHTGDTSMKSSVYVTAGARDSNADLSTTNTTFTWYESGALSYTDGTKYNQGHNLETSGASISGQTGEGKLLHTVTGVSDIEAVAEKPLPEVMAY